MRPNANGFGVGVRSLLKYYSTVYDAKVGAGFLVEIDKFIWKPDP